MISRCFRDGLFYEARYHGEPVCVFVGKDEAGKAKSACMRSIAGSLRKDVYGSDKEYSFCYPPRNPEIRRVSLYMDNDLGGLKNARRIKAMLHEDQRFRHIRVGINPPRTGKDYNEMLLHVAEHMKGRHSIAASAENEALSCESMLRWERQRHNKLGKYIESISRSVSTEVKKYAWFNAHIWGL